MAQKFGLFNSVGGSPAYNDVDIAGMLSLITGNAGYVVGYGGELAVTPGAGFQVIVGTGGAWLGDPPGWWYINNEPLTLSIDAEVGGYSRIDRVVLKLDRNTEALNITAQIVKGTPAASGPVAPSFTQNSTVYDFSLARVLVTGGVSSVTVADERMQCYKMDSTTRSQSSGAYTLKLSDMNQVIRTHGSTITIPPQSNVLFPVGAEIAFIQSGSSANTFIAGTGVTIRAEDNANKSAGQYTSCALLNNGNNEWYLVGRITP